MHPVTGPFARETFSMGPPNSLGQRSRWAQTNYSWYRQAKPYNLALAYEAKHQKITGATTSYGQALFYFDQCMCMSVAAMSQTYQQYREHSFNEARADFIRNLHGTSVNLGAATLEMRKSVDMISSRANQMIKFVRALKKFRFDEAARLLGMSKKPRSLKRDTKAYASNFLEYKFGWVPVVSDIKGALEVLAGGYPAFRVSGRATVDGQKSRLTVNTSSQKLGGDCSFSSSTEIVSSVRTINPNQALFTQLGLNNPVAAFWEAIPFSFVFDYFVNVEQYLTGHTDTYGFSLGETSWTWRIRASSRDYNYWQKVNGVFQHYAIYTGSSCSVIRSTGSLPGPTLKIRPPWRVSCSRASTSVALLLQFMR